jgi:hypothetical protein
MPRAWANDSADPLPPSGPVPCDYLCYSTWSAIQLRSFEVLIVVGIKIMVFWEVMPCSLVDTYQL